MKRLIAFIGLLFCYQISSATTVKLISIGPGDAFWSAFGHTAIAVDDVVYGFGYFSFDEVTVASFLANQMDYDLGVSDFDQEVYLAQLQNRDFSVIELNLSASEVEQISGYLKWHSLPENQSYPYDYFLNNCSTKVRDVINTAWQQQLKQHAQSDNRNHPKNSYIGQTFPAKHQGLMNFGLALGYGWPAYAQRNAWELMAFPVYFEQYLEANFSQQLQARQVLFEAQLTPPLKSFVLTHWVLLTYLLMWCLLLAFKATQKLAAKAWFLWHGLLGLVMLVLWLLTPHIALDWNFNVLLMTPLGWLLVKYPRLKVIWLVALSWLLWLVLAIYLQAWYLMPLIIPALMSLKITANQASER